MSGRCQPATSWPSGPTLVWAGKPSQSRGLHPCPADPLVGGHLAGGRVEGGDRPEDPVEQPRQDVAEDQAEEHRDPPQEAAEADRHRHHRDHGEQRHPLVLGPVDVGHHRGQVEADQHHDRPGDHRRQHRVDDPRAGQLDEQAAQGQDHAGDQDGPGHLGRVAALGADGHHRADERRRGAQVARHLVLHDEQEADRGDAAHHDRELGVEAHHDREDEGRAEHRDHVLGAEADRPRPRQPLVGPDHRPRGRRLAVVDHAPAEQSHDPSPFRGAAAGRRPRGDGRCRNAVTIPRRPGRAQPPPDPAGRGWPDGDSDPQDGLARPGVDGDRAPVALDHDAPGDVEAEAGALAHVLGGVEGLEGAARHLRRHSRAAVADLDDDAVAIQPGGQPQRARAVHGVDRVVDQVGPDPVELAGVGLDRGDAGAVVAPDRHAAPELVPQHHQRALQAVGHVGLLQRRAVQLRVGPDRGDQLGDAPGRLLDLPEQGGDRVGARHPLQAGLERRSLKRGRDPCAPGRIGAGGVQRRGQGPAAGDPVAAEPGRERLLPVGPGQRVRVHRPGPELAAQRVQGGELAGRELAGGEPAQRRDEGLGRRLEGVHGPGGRRGRVVDLVGQAGGEGPQGDQGLALPGGRLDRARRVVEPLDEVAAEREPGVGPLAQHLGRDPQHPAGGSSPAGGEVDAVLVPGAEPAGPAAGHVHPGHHGVLAADMADEVDGPVDQQPPEVGVLALAEQVDPGLDADLGAARGQLGQLAVAEAVEDGQRAEIVGAHQIVAR